MGIERSTDIGYGFAVIANDASVQAVADITEASLADHYDVVDSTQVRNYLASIGASVEVSQDQWSGEFPARLVFLAADSTSKIDKGLTIAEDNASIQFRKFASYISERVDEDIRIGALMYSSIL